MSDSEEYAFEGIAPMWKPPQNIGAVQLTVQVDFFPEGEAGDEQRADLEIPSEWPYVAKDADGNLVGPVETTTGFADTNWEFAAFAGLVFTLARDFERNAETIREAMNGVLGSLDYLLDLSQDGKDES